MVSQANKKVTSSHLQRKAYLYIRQSSIRQVRMNQESGKRQYALKQQAIELGWPRENIIVIDGDQGHSAVSTVDRECFQKLVTEVGLGKAGIVLGIEVSRLARNNADWHRLLEICGVTQTLILDDDGLYDPRDFNDRLLLGLKGTMSEAEVHILKSRMQGGLMNKAKRGELRLSLPVGFVYDDQGKVILDPDKQVQQAVRLLFETHHRLGTVYSTMLYFIENGILFPRHDKNLSDGKLVWKKPDSSLIIHILRNPVYAGAFAYGRSKTVKCPNGRRSVTLPINEWKVLIKDAHEGYISWEEFEKNQSQWMLSNKVEKKSKPREGCALLQGVAICGICGRRMFSNYYNRKNGQLIPQYICNVAHSNKGEPRCQSFGGELVDKAVGNLLMESVTPLTLEVALNVQKELEQRAEEADKIRRQQVERAQYEVNLAERRYMQVDPENRLVAASLEDQWNEKLRCLEKEKEEYERLCKEDKATLSKKNQKEILDLARDFPSLWQNPDVPHRERKRMLRLLVEDVTLLLGGKTITIHVHFKSGAIKTLSVPKPLTLGEQRTTKPEVVEEIDRLLEEHTPFEVAKMLNNRGFKTGTGQKISVTMIQYTRYRYKLKSHEERLRERGYLDVNEMAKRLDSEPWVVYGYYRKGLIKKRPADRTKNMYEVPADEEKIKKIMKKNKLFFGKVSSTKT